MSVADVAVTFRSRELTLRPPAEQRQARQAPRATHGKHRPSSPAYSLLFNEHACVASCGAHLLAVFIRASQPFAPVAH
jgi:hypothetical protein